MTEKNISLAWDFGQRPKYFPGFGTVAITSHQGWEVRILPASECLNVRPALLELWAQVVVRGYLDDQGVFSRWDEPTWEKKRQELAAMPVPISTVSFRF